MPDCLFCRIAAGEIPAARVAESPLAIAFRDIDAQAPTHVLVIPRRHVGSVAELEAGDAGLLAELFELARRVASEAGLGNGYRVVTNVGPDAGQSVAHLHLHVLGGRPMRWPPG